MKKIIFMTSILSFVLTSAMSKHSDVQWLQERIDKCKQRGSENNSDSWNAHCGFMMHYIKNFYPTLCGGQGNRPRGILYPFERDTYANRSQRDACQIIHAALTDKNFVEQIIN